MLTFNCLSMSNSMLIWKVSVCDVFGGQSINGLHCN